MNNIIKYVIGTWLDFYLNSPSSTQAKFRIGKTTVYVIESFGDLNIIFDDVYIVCDHSIDKVLHSVKEMLQ